MQENNEPNKTVTFTLLHCQQQQKSKKQGKKRCVPSPLPRPEFLVLLNNLQEQVKMFQVNGEHVMKQYPHVQDDNSMK